MDGSATSAPAFNRRLDFRPTLDIAWDFALLAGERSGQVLEATCWIGPRTEADPPHIHPAAKETIEVVEGRIEVMLDGSWTAHGPGDHVRVSPGVAHTFRNPFDEPARLTVRLNPAMGFEAYRSDLHALVTSGKVTSYPPRSPRARIYTAMLVTSYPYELRLTPGRSLVYHTLAGAGRLRGLRLGPAPANAAEHDAAMGREFAPATSSDDD